MSTQLDETTEIRQDLDKAKAAHIIKTEEGENAAAKVMEARLYGYPIEALCGHIFVPQQDPQKLPMCAACKEIHDIFYYITII